MTDGIRLYPGGALPFIAILLLIGLVIVIIPLLFLGLVGAAFTRLGFSWTAALAVVLLMLFGSFINIPLSTVRREMVRAGHGEFSYDGTNTRASAPVWDTVISLNLGGALIPVIVSFYLLSRAVSLMGPSVPHTGGNRHRDRGSDRVCCHPFSARVRYQGTAIHPRACSTALRAAAHRGDRVAGRCHRVCFRHGRHASRCRYCPAPCYKGS